jgi:anti-sigma factor RsiW
LFVQKFYQHASFAMFCSHDPLELMRFAEGNASTAELAKIQARLHQCRHCQKQLAELLETAATLKQFRAPELPPVEIERWVHHLRRARQPQPSKWPLRNWLARLRPVPVAALLALALVIFSFRAMQQKPVVAHNSQDELRLFLREHAIAQDQGAFTTETLSALLLTENGRGSDR